MWFVHLLLSGIHRKPDEIVRETIFAGCFTPPKKNTHTHTVQCSFKLKAFFQHYCSEINEFTIFAVKICTKCSSFICSCSTQFWYENPEKSYCWWVFFPSLSLKNILKQYCYQIFNVALEAYCNSCSQRENIHFTIA